MFMKFVIEFYLIKMKYLTSLKKVGIIEIITKYTNTFQGICEKPLSSDLEIKINSWTSFLKKAIGGLKVIRIMCKEINEFCYQELQRTIEGTCRDAERIE